MNWQFYDFLANYFTQVSRGQKQVDNITEWMQHGFKGLNDMAALFQRSYGLKGLESGDAQDSKLWQEAIADFTQASAQFAGLWGWIDPAEHRKVLKKCEALEKEIEEQNLTIDRLRELLSQKGMAHAELFKHLQDSMSEQSSQFNDLMLKISGTDNSKT